MANLTLTIDDQLLKMARMRAVEQGTSVNAVVRDYLERYARLREIQMQILRETKQIADEDARNGGAERARRRGKRSWSREAIYEERLGRYGRRR
jgi:hypothetical protein